MKSVAGNSIRDAVKRKGESNMSEIGLLERGTDQAPSPLSQQQVDQSQPMVTMPASWVTHCAGCSAPAPESSPEGMLGNRSMAGCRCLMCPDWYSCLACAQEQRGNAVHVYGVGISTGRFEVVGEVEHDLGEGE